MKAVESAKLLAVRAQAEAKAASVKQALNFTLSVANAELRAQQVSLSDKLEEAQTQAIRSKASALQSAVIEQRRAASAVERAKARAASEVAAAKETAGAELARLNAGLAKAKRKSAASLAALSAEHFSRAQNMSRMLSSHQKRLEATFSDLKKSLKEKHAAEVLDLRRKAAIAAQSMKDQLLDLQEKLALEMKVQLERHEKLAAKRREEQAMRDDEAARLRAAHDVTLAVRGLFCSPMGSHLQHRKFISYCFQKVVATAKTKVDSVSAKTKEKMALLSRTLEEATSAVDEHVASISKQSQQSVASIIAAAEKAVVAHKADLQAQVSFCTICVIAVPLCQLLY